MHIVRLSLALAACFSLTSCGLINTALRMAPYLLMFADENPDGSKTGAQQRGQQIQERGHFAPQHPKWTAAAQPRVAARGVVPATPHF